MKLFAKRSKQKASVTDAPATPRQEDETVVSYFSAGGSAGTKKAQAKGNGNGLLSLEQLQEMDPASLTSKQRRMLKRMMSRNEKEDETNEMTGGGDKEHDGQVPSQSSPKPDDSGTKSQTDFRQTTASEATPIVATTRNGDDTHKIGINVIDVPSEPVESCREGNEVLSGDKVVQLSTSDSSAGVCAVKRNDTGLADDQQKMLQGLNSKERRKMLRQFQREQREQHGSSEASSHDEKKRKEHPGEDASAPVDELPPSKKSKKMKDLSHLPTEERKRRENQREMQKLAAERRASGEGVNSKFSHPLNSERRRANRRKPGKSGQLAAMRKENREQRAEMGSYNAFGYNKRKTNT